MAEFYPSLQTQFNARLDSPTLQQLRIFGFRWARMDCQTCDVDTMLAMIADAKAHQLTPLPIVYDLERLEHLAAGADVEWGNEPDGDIWPTTYRDGLNAACAVAHSRGLVLWAPAISNLDRDSLLWLEAVRGAGWPDGLHGISAHRYGDGTFAFSHPGFPSRDAEVDRLLELCDGLPYIITEFGYPTKAVGRRGRLEQRSLTEAKQSRMHRTRVGLLAPARVSCADPLSNQRWHSRRRRVWNSPM